MRRLHTTYAISDVAHHRLFRSYLLGRSQYVRIGTSCSSVIDLICGVPQGSVLGPFLFILYTAGLISLIQSHGLTLHLYADDTQVYGSCPASNVDVFSAQLTACSCAVASWMQSNRLQLNSDKTEVLLWCATTRRQHQLPRSPLLVDGTPINPVQSVRDISIFIDADLVMRTHVQKTVSICFAVLRQLRSIRHSVPATTFQTLIVSLVLSRLDYGNAALGGRPAYLFWCLQSVVNAALRPHLRRTHLPPLAPGLVEGKIQDDRAHVQGPLGTAPSYLSQVVAPLKLKAFWSLDVQRSRQI